MTRARLLLPDLFTIDACATAALGLIMADVGNGLDFQTRHLTYALRAGEPWRVARALIYDAGAIGVAKPGPYVERVLRQAEDLLRRHPDVHLSGILEQMWCTLEFGRCNWPRVVEIARFGQSFRLPLDQQWIMGASLMLMTRLYSEIQIGDLDAVRRQADEVLRQARQNGDLFREVFLHSMSLADSAPRR